MSRASSTPLCFASFAGFALLISAGQALAQGKPLPPIDPLPPTEPPSPTSTPTSTSTPSPTSTSTPSPSPSPSVMGELPPPYVEASAPRPKHAPRNALYVGARLGLLGYGGKFFVNDTNGDETTGNFVRPGASLEANIGARLNRRYMPYLLVEYAALQPGHRFDAETEASSRLLGLGFRFVLGNVDNAGFLADLSLAQRSIVVVRDGQTFKMSGPEIFRLGLGAEIRLSTLLTLSPLAHLSGGSMAQSDGDVAYVAGQADGQTRPTFLTDASISKSQRSYLVVGIGCGVHFDLFGK